MSKQLTRKELYDLVWARPMTKVAAELGISDVALHKICDKHRIPAPGRGYWAKIAAGQKPKPMLLREVTDPYLNNVFIHGSALQRLPPAVLDARTRAKAAARERTVNPPDQPGAPSDLSPLLLPLKHKLETMKVGGDGLAHISGKKLFHVNVAPESATRVLATLNALINAATAQGHTVDSDDSGLYLSVDGEHVSLSITEKFDRIAHQISEAEAKAMQKWEAERERKKRRMEWYGDWDKPKIPEWDFVPNGLLVLEIDQGSHWDGLRRKFSDGTRQRLEGMVDGILTAATTCVAARKAKREEAASRELEWKEQERRRKEQERINRLETKRREFLDRQIRLFERAQQVASVVNFYHSTYPRESCPPSCRAFLDWAQGYIDRLHARLAPEKLAAVLDEHGLMDDSTDVASWTKID